ncbi:MAG: hypothetical protein ACT4OU_04820 [Hyphomicrobium sp.]
MKSYAAMSLAALLALSVVLPTVSTEAEARRGTKRAIAAGVAAAVIGTAIVNSDRSYARGRAHRERCEDLDYRCDMGSSRACYKFDRYC